MSNATARRIEALCRAPNDIFAKAAWGRPWDEVFAYDVGQDFVPNDYAIIGVPDEMRAPLARAVSVLTKRASRIMERPIFRSDEKWNTLRRPKRSRRAAAE
jgi:hypothetical protein